MSRYHTLVNEPKIDQSTPHQAYFGNTQFNRCWFIFIRPYARMGSLHSQWDYILLILLAYGVLITFSGKGLVAPKLTHPIFGWLGAFSFNLYLGHGFWSHALEDFFPNLPYGQQLAIYCALSAGTALVIMYVSKLLQYLWKKYWPSLKPAFFKVEDALTVQD